MTGAQVKRMVLTHPLYLDQASECFRICPTAKPQHLKWSALHGDAAVVVKTCSAPPWLTCARVGMQRVEAVYKQAIIFNIAATGKHPIPDPAAPGEEVKAAGRSQTDQQSYSCESSLAHRGSDGLGQPRLGGGRQRARQHDSRQSPPNRP